jgi:hypothetical protein
VQLGFDLAQDAARRTLALQDRRDELWLGLRATVRMRVDEVVGQDRLERRGVLLAHGGVDAGVKRLQERCCIGHWPAAAHSM